MSKTFQSFTKILLIICLLFSYSGNTLANDAEAVFISKNLDINFVSISQNEFEFTASHYSDDSEYFVRIFEQDDGTYLWNSGIRVKGKTISEQIFVINKIKEEIDPPQFKENFTSVLLGENDQVYLQNYLDKTFDFVELDLEEESVAKPQAAFFIPIAIGSLSTSIFIALEAALYATLTASAATAASIILEDRLRTSRETNEIYTDDYHESNWQDFTGIPSVTTTSATRHISRDAILEIAERIKNDRFDNGMTEIYTSTTDRTKVLVVYDITSRLNATVNRHLGNRLDGSVIWDSSYRNETLNLNGYSVFLIFDHRRGWIFHAHFVPWNDRLDELRYQRFRGGFDLKLYPDVKYTPYYNRSNPDISEKDYNLWRERYERAVNNRNLLPDSKGRPSVVPYK